MKQYPVAPGREQHPSPIGEWVITYKSTDWGGRIRDTLARIKCAVGDLRDPPGTNLPHTIGQDASHGCFRMFNEHVEELFSLVNTGTLFIVDGPLPRARRVGAQNPCPRGQRFRCVARTKPVAGFRLLRRTRRRHIRIRVGNGGQALATRYELGSDRANQLARVLGAGVSRVARYGTLERLAIQYNCDYRI